jgi:choline-sulfatase
VPLVYSNPRPFPEPLVSHTMVLHVDFLPAMASLFDAPATACAEWQGVDYSSVILDPDAPAPKDYIVFTDDDYQSGQAGKVHPGPLNHIVSIRGECYKLAKYYSVVNPDLPVEWEMYDLLHDPLETTNLAYSGYHRSVHQEAEFVRLQANLRSVEQGRLQPLPNTPAPLTPES